MRRTFIPDIINAELPLDNGARPYRRMVDGSNRFYFWIGHHGGALLEALARLAAVLICIEKRLHLHLAGNARTQPEGQPPGQIAAGLRVSGIVGADERRLVHQISASAGGLRVSAWPEQPALAPGVPGGQLDWRDRPQKGSSIPITRKIRDPRRFAAPLKTRVENGCRVLHRMRAPGRQRDVAVRRHERRWHNRGGEDAGLAFSG
jgi:hypothetical protein